MLLTISILNFGRCLFIGLKISILALRVFMVRPYVILY
ncbi:hypothetical protein BBUWI9123_E0014 (plasmid) [Borreliella burgdorferi WI91-23]|nr:hypothetical protein BBUWI9123_E0014 [Borreliella burgdorferi WI91-23]